MDAGGRAAFRRRALDPAIRPTKPPQTVASMMTSACDMANCHRRKRTEIMPAFCTPNTATSSITTATINNLKFISRWRRAPGRGWLASADVLFPPAPASTSHPPRLAESGYPFVGGLEHPVPLGFLRSLVDKLLSFASPLVILVFAGGLRHLAPG